MPVAPFESFQAYECAVALAVQNGYVHRVQPSAYKGLVANKAAVALVNGDLQASGTSGYRGIFTSQRTRSLRYAAIDLNIEAMDSEAVKAALDLVLGGDGKLTNDIKFGSIGVRHTGDNGVTLNDVAITSAVFTFRSGEVADIELSGVCCNDWNEDTAPPAVVPTVATPLLIDDLILTWKGGDLPFSEVAFTVTQTVTPVFANESFPVSFQAKNDRGVTCRVVFPPTSTTIEMLKALRTDEAGDLEMESRIGSFSALLRNARVLQATFPDFESGNVQPLEVVFGASATDRTKLELELEVG